MLINKFEILSHQSVVFVKISRDPKRKEGRNDRRKDYEISLQFKEVVRKYKKIQDTNIGPSGLGGNSTMSFRQVMTNR